MIWGLEIKPMTNLLAFPVFSSTTIRIDCYLLTAHMLYFSLFFSRSPRREHGPAQWKEFHASSV